MWDMADMIRKFMKLALYNGSVQIGAGSHYVHYPVVLFHNGSDYYSTLLKTSADKANAIYYLDGNWRLDYSRKQLYAKLKREIPEAVTIYAHSKKPE